MRSLWRGSLLPLGREAALSRTLRCFRKIAFTFFGSAAQPSGSKLPRHGAAPVRRLVDRGVQHYRRARRRPAHNHH
ncbi:hypothetical protein B1219_03750 [Pseudomonas ogarae]|nr:hypothetical protein B1219_03750 [Pseudomonas ogarae]OPG77927.1 hypothetical protein B1218_18300 [Pseudomonas ogarae]